MKFSLWWIWIRKHFPYSEDKVLNELQFIPIMQRISIHSYFTRSSTNCNSFICKGNTDHPRPRPLFAHRWLPTSPIWSVLWYTFHIKYRYPYFLCRINPDSVDRNYNPQCTNNSFELKADTLYPVTMCQNIEETLTLCTTDSDLTMENPDHIGSIGFFEYNNGIMSLYKSNLEEYTTLNPDKLHLPFTGSPIPGGLWRIGATRGRRLRRRNEIMTSGCW